MVVVLNVCMSEQVYDQLCNIFLRLNNITTLLIKLVPKTSNPIFTNLSYQLNQMIFQHVFECNMVINIINCSIEGVEPKYYLLFNYLISDMTEQTQTQSQDPKKQPIANNRWTNISSDEDESESEHSEKQQQPIVKPKKEEVVAVEAEVRQEEVKKRQPNIVPFDARKKFRGEFANIKTVKGGFKAEKLEQKKFRLDTVRNPFQVDDDSSQDEKQHQQAAEAVMQETQAQQTPAVEEKQVEEKGKKTKKSKKQQEKEQLQALLKELNVQTEPKAEQGDKKKKKKKAKKEKVQGEQQQKEETKPEQVKTQSQAVQQQAVNRQAIEQVMRKKAEAAKNAAKKTGKVSVSANARKAIEEREAKNKQKKVYVDL